MAEPAANNTQRYRVSSPRIIRESFDGEVIIVNLDNGTYYSLRGTGAQLWTLIEQSHSEAEIRAEMQAACAADTLEAATLEADITSFLAQLLEESLIVAAPASQTPSPSTKPARIETYQPPILEKFSDMQELLLLDPVHEVGTDGWPLREGETPATHAVKINGSPNS